MDGTVPGELTPDEAFQPVASDVRFDILRALWDFQPPSDEDAPVSFSRLHDATDVRDSGQFTDHLEKLFPRFVRKLDAGYELTFAGTQIVGVAVSGV